MLFFSSAGYAWREKTTFFATEMMNARCTYDKDRLASRLLTVTLLLSLFTFSGYQGSSPSKKQQATRSELVVSTKNKICKRTISYTSAFVLPGFIGRDSSAGQHLKIALIACNELNKVKFDTIKRLNFRKSYALFLQVKTVPQSPDEDIFTTFIG